jgi:translin
MQNLEEITERLHQKLETRTAARDITLSNARTLIRHCANAIRALHRDEGEKAQENLDAAMNFVQSLQSNLGEYPELYYAGYSQDALKEFAEAKILYALLRGDLLPTPEELRLEPSTYLQGLAEAASELRRRCLDSLLHGKSEEAERLLGYMDDIYAVLVTMDYPDAITGGLRRLTDLVRSVTERTRGDIILSLRQENLEASLKQLEKRLSAED